MTEPEKICAAWDVFPEASGNRKNSMPQRRLCERSHIGRMGIREHARKIGAEVGRESERGKGTVVSVALPLGR